MFLTKNMKNIIFFLLKFFVFLNSVHLHGRVFVQCNVRRLSLTKYVVSIKVITKCR